MTLTNWLPLVRHSLQIVGGMLIAGGYLNEELLVAFTGVGVSIFTALWYKLSAK
jgi:hypothetical protein